MIHITDLQKISNAAINGNIEVVRQMLSNGMNYHLAYLYVEAFHQDYKASELILKEAKCKCGNIASKWLPEPICGACMFKRSMRQIEYGKQ